MPVFLSLSQPFCVRRFFALPQSWCIMHSDAMPSRSRSRAKIFTHSLALKKKPSAQILRMVQTFTFGSGSTSHTPRGPNGISSCNVACPPQFCVLKVSIRMKTRPFLCRAVWNQIRLFIRWSDQGLRPGSHRKRQRCVYHRRRLPNQWTLVSRICAGTQSAFHAYARRSCDPFVVVWVFCCSSSAVQLFSQGRNRCRNLVTTKFGPTASCGCLCGHRYRQRPGARDTPRRHGPVLITEDEPVVWPCVGQ